MSDDEHLYDVIADYGDACAEMQAEIDRLRSELAKERARIAELEAANSEIAIEALRDHRELHARAEQAEAELAAKDAAHDETRGLVRDLTTCLENRNRELSEAAKVVRKCHDERDAAVTAERAKDARIAELEKERDADLWFDQLKKEAAISSMLRARAERAEAECKRLRVVLEAAADALDQAEMGINPDADRRLRQYVIQTEKMVRAALNPSPADGLPPFKPCVVFHEEMCVTEMLLEDCLIVWKPWGPYKGHAVDCGYSEDDRLVGIKIWDDVRHRDSINYGLGPLDKL